VASKSPRQKALNREREAAKAAGKLPEWYAARETERAHVCAQISPQATPRAVPAEPVPFKSIEREAFDAAYSGAPITLEAAVWTEGDKYVRWTLETNSMGSRLSHSRNRANPTNI
jgi:hypothetical protein